MVVAKLDRLSRDVAFIAGLMTKRGLPRRLRDLAALARRYDQEAHAPLLSVGVQRLLLAPLVRRPARRGALPALGT